MLAKSVVPEECDAMPFQNKFDITLGWLVVGPSVHHRRHDATHRASGSSAVWRSRLCRTDYVISPPETPWLPSSFTDSNDRTRFLSRQSSTALRSFSPS